MSTTLSLPKLTKYIKIGALPDGTPVTIEDLTFMTDYKSPYEFSVRDKSESQSIGISVTEVIVTADGWKDRSPPRGTVKGTVGSDEMNKLVID